MQKRRRLGDLYVRGIELAIDDETGAAVKVWLQKLNEPDRDTILRRAGAAKARFLIDSDDEDSDAFAAMYSVCREYEERDGLIAIAIGEDIAKFRARKESELALDEEGWAKDGYLQGLADAWVGSEEAPGLAAAFAEDPGDPEARRVSDELARFEDEIGEAVRAEVQRLEREWNDAPDEELWKTCTRELLRRRGEDAFLAEYERQQVFFTTRDPERHSERYFETVAEVDDLEDLVRQKLIHAYSKLIVTPSEGKGSRVSQESSTSPEPSDGLTPEPSGPATADS